MSPLGDETIFVYNKLSPENETLRTAFLHFHIYMLYAETTLSSA